MELRPVTRGCQVPLTSREGTVTSRPPPPTSARGRPGLWACLSVCLRLPGGGGPLRATGVRVSVSSSQGRLLPAPVGWCRPCSLEVQVSPTLSVPRVRASRWLVSVVRPPPRRVRSGPLRAQSRSTAGPRRCRPPPRLVFLLPVASLRALCLSAAGRGVFQLQFPLRCWSTETPTVPVCRACLLRPRW